WPFQSSQIVFPPQSRDGTCRRIPSVKGQLASKNGPLSPLSLDDPAARHSESKWEREGTISVMRSAPKEREELRARAEITSHFAAGPQARWRGASDGLYPGRYVR